jgi:hypothetical protein
VITLERWLLGTKCVYLNFGLFAWRTSEQYVCVWMDGWEMSGSPGAWRRRSVEVGVGDSHVRVAFIASVHNANIAFRTLNSVARFSFVGLVC